MTLELRSNKLRMSDPQVHKDGSGRQRGGHERYGGNVTILGWTRHAVVAASGDANRGDIRCTTQGPFPLRD
jgi:hypothetical protein